MGLRQDFLIHKGKTVESFRLVRADISGIHLSIEHVNDRFASVESLISSLGSQLSNLRKSIEKLSSEIILERDSNFLIKSKISGISDSVENLAVFINSFKNSLSLVASKNKKMSKAQTLKNKQLDSSVKSAQEGIKKLKNIIKRKLGAANKKDIELEAKLKKQLGKIVLINRKLSGKKFQRKRAKKKIEK